MKKELDYSKVESRIVNWLIEQAKLAKVEGYVIGVSGGVDSAVVSTLAAKTGLKLYTIQMPIRQKIDEVSRASKHIKWLMNNFANVETIDCDLTSTFGTFLDQVESAEDSEKQGLAEANTRSRLRMVTLYYYACLKKCLVLGTGNKVEDFGIQFFTKYGDGGVDISPIGDLMKSEVRGLGRYIGVSDEIINAKPTDGLWKDGRGDEDAIGATYDDLEAAMEWVEKNPRRFNFTPDEFDELPKKQANAVRIYKERHFANWHKMEMPPICSIENLRK